MSRLREYLLGLAGRNARIYARSDHVCGVYLGGSLSRGSPNRYSDIDTIVLCEEVPQDAELRRLAESNGGRSWHVVSRGESGVLERYWVNGVECEFAWGLVSWYEAILHAVLQEHSLDPVHQLVASGLLDGVILHGEELVGGMQERLRAFPEELRAKMVRVYLKPCPVAEIRHRILKRDSRIWFYGVLNALQRSIMGVLFGLNRMYHPGEYKKLDHFIRRMEIRPARLLERLNRMYAVRPTEALRSLVDLYGETLDRIAQHLPEVDLVEMRKLHDQRLRPIRLPPDP